MTNQQLTKKFCVNFLFWLLPLTSVAQQGVSKAVAPTHVPDQAISSNQAADKCEKESFEIGFRTPENNGLHISVSPEQLSRTHFWCLANQLQEAHPDARKMEVAIYTDKKAASGLYMACTIEPGPLSGVQEHSFHGMYRLNRDQGLDKIELIPTVICGSRFAPQPSAVIDPQKSTLPACEKGMAIEDHCLVEMEPVSGYPYKAWENGTQAEFDIRITVAPQGNVTAAKPIDIRWNGRSHRKDLRSAAISLARSMRFEPSGKLITKTISIKYEIDQKFKAEALQTYVEFNLPESIAVRSVPFQ